MVSLENTGLKILVLSNNPKSPRHNQAANEKYLPQFYKLRYSVFSENGRKSLCGEGPGEYDGHEDTYTIVLLDSAGTVVGGRTIGIHEPHSGTELSTDKRIVNEKNGFVRIRDTLAHLDVEEKKYAYFSGMCFDQTVRGKGYSGEFNRATYDLVKEIECDFSVTQLVPTNFIRMTRAALENGAHQVVARPDQRAIVGTFRTYISFLDEQELPLQTPEQKENGIGMRVTPANMPMIAGNLRSIFPDHYSY